LKKLFKVLSFGEDLGEAIFKSSFQYCLFITNRLTYTYITKAF
jgi:hypothetical protein